MKSLKFYRVGFYSLAVVLLIMAFAAFLPVTINGAGGLFTTYNGIPCFSNCFPTQYAVSDAGTQSAALGSTLLYTVPSTGQGRYKICYTMKVTVAATTSSLLGGAGGFQVIYTDADDSSAVTSPIGALFGSTAAVLALNTNQAQSSGCIVVNAKASTTISYQIGYTAVGVTQMSYIPHVWLESQ